MTCVASPQVKRAFSNQFNGERKGMKDEGCNLRARKTSLTATLRSLTLITPASGGVNRDRPTPPPATVPRVAGHQVQAIFSPRRRGKPAFLGAPAALAASILEPLGNGQTAQTGKSEGIPRRSAAASASMTRARVTVWKRRRGSRGHGASSRSQVESRRGRRRRRCWAKRLGKNERTAVGGRTIFFLGSSGASRRKKGGGREGPREGGENAYGGRGDGML